MRFLFSSLIFTYEKVVPFSSPQVLVTSVSISYFLSWISIAFSPLSLFFHMDESVYNTFTLSLNGREKETLIVGSWRSVHEIWESIENVEH